MKTLLLRLSRAGKPFRVFFLDCEIMFANAALSKINMVGTAIVHIKINNRFMGHILFFSKF